MPPPPFVLRFLGPVLSPIAGAPRQLLVVTPGHPTRTLATLTADGRRVVRERYVEDGALYGILLILCDDGALEFLTPQDQQLLFQALAG